MMSRLSALLVNNNNISKLGSTIGDNLPSLTALILTNNKVSHLSEVDKLAKCKKLEILSLLENPVALKQHYRLFIIHRIPSLKCLDYRKVSKKERDDAKKLFKTPAGNAFLASIQAEGSSTSQQAQSKPVPIQLTDSQKAQIKRAIERATTKEEIDAIEMQLKVLICVYYHLLVP